MGLVLTLVRALYLVIFPPAACPAWHVVFRFLIGSIPPGFPTIPLFLFFTPRHGETDMKCFSPPRPERLRRCVARASLAFVLVSIEFLDMMH